jgi:hypothetical protein
MVINDHSHFLGRLSIALPRSARNALHGSRRRRREYMTGRDVLNELAAGFRV